MASADILNELFIQKLDTPEGKAKVAAYGGSFIRDRLREESFTGKILPESTITRADLQVSLEHDTLIRIEQMEPQSKAMPVTFRGEPTARVIRGSRFAIPFFTISSEKFEKTEQELMAYTFPITKVIEDNSMKDMQEILDREFLLHCESAVQRLQMDANNPAAGTILEGTDVLNKNTETYGVTKGELAQFSASLDSYDSLPCQSSDFTNLYKLFLKSTGGNGRLRCDRFLMTEYDFEDIMTWAVEDVGNKVMSEIVVDGYKYNSLKGRKYTRTIKTDILREGNIYAFTSPDFLGKNYVLNQVKFYIDKVGNKITWWAWKDVGLGIGNIASIRKLELYPGSVVPGALSNGNTGTSVADSTVYTSKLPKGVEDLGAINHRVDQNYTYPQIQAF